MEIIKNKCIGCGACLNSCSFNAIEIIEGKAIFNDNCTLCGLCISVCPENAIVRNDKKQTKDFSDYSGIYVFVEKEKNVVKEVSYQLVSKAKILAKSSDDFVTSIIINPTEAEISKLSSAGSDKVIKVKANLPKENLLANAQVLFDIVKVYKPNILLIGATPDGRSLAPRVAAKLKTGLTADCTMLSIDNDLLVQTRPAYGGNIMAEIICPNHRPQMATVRPNTFKIEKYDLKSEIISINYEKTFNTGIRVLDTLYEENKSDLEHAEIIVGAGRGISNKETLELVFEFAELLNASVSASRPLVDASWLGYERQVGQTGKTVSPKIYIACGISGAIQHMAGVSGAETIIAINNDPNANIFKYADYSLVGDVANVLKTMINKLSSRKD